MEITYQNWNELPKTLTEGEIVEALEDRPHTTKELEEKLPYHYQTIYPVIRRLVDKGIVKKKRISRSIWYGLASRISRGG
jgi:predicted transcriptional regulator